MRRNCQSAGLKEPTSKKSQVLIVVAIPTHFREMIRVARLLKNSKKYEPVIYFQVSYAGVDSDVSVCEAENIAHSRYDNVLNLTTVNTTPVRSRIDRLSGWCLEAVFKMASLPALSVFLDRLYRNGWTRWFVRPAAKIFKILFLKLIRRFRGAVSPLNRQMVHFCRHIEQLFDTYLFSLIILPEDNLFYCTPVMIHEGKKRGIQSIIVPFTMVNKREWLVAFKDDPLYQFSNFFNFLVAYLFPKWVHRFEDKQLVIRADLVLLYELLGLTPPEPWLINSGFTDVLAAESPYMLGYYIKAGIELDRIVVTGALYDDALHQSLQQADQKKQQLFAELKLKTALPIVLCALPPDQLCTIHSKDCDFHNYEDLVRFWMQVLSAHADKCHIVVNLHPRTTLQEVNFLREFPVHISSWSISDLVPLVDVYVSSCSATIRMAISCGIPVVNYDVYRYRYGDYDDAGGVITIEAQEAFANTMQQLIHDPLYFQDIKSRQQEAMKAWAMMDGRCGERLLAVLDTIALSSQTP